MNRCENAKTPASQCKCRCGGKMHGMGRSTVLDSADHNRVGPTGFYHHPRWGFITREELDLLPVRYELTPQGWETYHLNGTDDDPLEPIRRFLPKGAGEAEDPAP